MARSWLRHVDVKCKETNILDLIGNETRNSKAFLVNILRALNHLATEIT
jgi:hypothetical protein